jgi:dihydropteroate synthase
LELKEAKLNSKRSLNLQGKLMDLSRPVIMGILNVTPDSFYAGSRAQSHGSIVSLAGKMLEEGAEILDIGGYSTRPEASNIPVKEEVARVVDAIRAVKQEYPAAVISIDTFRSEVARQAVEAGAEIINDVSGGQLDPIMFATVAELRVPYILMHMRGTPENMETLTSYDHLMNDLIDYFQRKLHSLHALGVADIVIDPGIGFAKTPEQGFEILRYLDYLQVLETPILVGVSRKSLIHKSLNSTPEESLNGTTALHMHALMNGARVLRAHDVKEAAETVKLYNLLQA